MNIAAPRGLTAWRRKRDFELVAPSDQLNACSKAELYQLAQAVDVPGRGSMSKAELVDALEQGR